MESQAQWYLKVEEVCRGSRQGGIAVVHVPSGLAVERCLDIVHEIQHRAL